MVQQQKLCGKTYFILGPGKIRKNFFFLFLTIFVVKPQSICVETLFPPFVTFFWPEKLRDGHEMVRNGERSETFAKSRSRFKNEGIIVI